MLPVGIGGGERGVLCTCNYVAREFGVKSAMPTFMAKKLCPQLIFIRPDFRKYKLKSRSVFEIFKRYSNKIEALSLDEAYLDVTDCEFYGNDAIKIAKAIKNDIFKEIGLTASAGVSYNKLLSKIGSDLYKPDGLAVLRPENIAEKIASFPIQKIWGVGTVGTKKLQHFGFRTFGDLQQASKLDLVNLFGDFGAKLYLHCRGIDHREVRRGRERKTLSVESTFYSDLSGLKKLEQKLSDVVLELDQRLEKQGHRFITGIFLKIKYDDFTSTTIESSVDFSYENFKALLGEKWGKRSDPVRLLGVGVKFHSPIQTGQLEFHFC